MADRTLEVSIELVSIRWVRVQVIIDARLVPGAAIDPGHLHLHLAGGATTFPPTHSDIADDRLTLRFNVMNGPGQDPLVPGRWTLGARVTVRPDIVDPATSTAEFQLIDGLFAVTPVFDVAAGSLSFDVAFDGGIQGRRLQRLSSASGCSCARS